jgi:hypothetical protein
LAGITSTKPTKKQQKPAGGRGGLDAVRALARPDEWALDMELRVDAHDFSLDGREYVRQIIRDNSPEIICPKAAQMAYTVSAITKSVHNVIMRDWNGLYLLPVKTGAIPFVQARIDPMIESNPALDHEFSSVDNRLHKQSKRGANLYIRGTNILRELQEIPVDFEIWDERDRMIDDIDGVDPLEEARHRMDGSRIKKVWILSTPTVEGYGVYADDAWDISDQHRWEVKCPHCSRYQTLNFNQPELDYSNLKLGDTYKDCVVECAFCNKKISDEERYTLNAEGRWVAHNLEGEIRGYHISQFNSPTQSVPEIMKAYFRGQREPNKLRSFWNQNMGRAYTAAGDKITVELLDKCRLQGYFMGGIPNSYVSVGIDVGMTLHVWCWQFDRYDNKLLWNLKTFYKWDDLENFLRSLTSWTGVIDAHPEKTKALELAKTFHGKLRVGFSEERDQASEIATFHPVKYGEAARVNIDKSAALDMFIADYLNGISRLPADARDLGETLPQKDFNGFYHQQIQMVRIEEPNTKGDMRGRWKKNRNPDHWHHAGMFATVASMQKPSLSVPAGLAVALNRNVISG